MIKNRMIKTEVAVPVPSLRHREAVAAEDDAAVAVGVKRHGVRSGVER